MPTGLDLQLDGKKRVLVYARSGKGKTSLIGKALEVPVMQPLYVFDFDLRINSILAVVEDRAALQHLEYDQYRDMEEAGRAFVQAEMKLRDLVKLNKQGQGPRTVCVDSLTFMLRSVMNRVLKLDGKGPTANPQLQNYLSQINIVEPFIASLCGGNWNVIVTCHEDTAKDEITGVPVRGIDLPGQLARRLPGYFNELWYAEVQQTKNGLVYGVRTQSSGAVEARSTYSRHLAPFEDQGIWTKLAKVDEEIGLAAKAA